MPGRLDKLPKKHRLEAQMSFIEEIGIPGCFRFQVNPRYQDERGLFVKPLHLDFLKKGGIQFECRESFLSFSKQGVLRGMHFQVPPFAVDKIVTCIQGQIWDVVLDLRRDSKTYGTACGVLLSAENSEALFIPEGCAHGFQVKNQEGAWVAYYCSKEYHAESDKGVHWSSVPIEWPIRNPLVSPRDEKFPHFSEIQVF